MRRHIPNAITLLNLLCGCAALVCLFQANFSQAVLWLFFAAVADFADGLVARVLHVTSELGAQLDSLADAVSFGVVPGAILYMMLAPIPLSDGVYWPALPAFLLSVFAILRLAKFNLDTRQSESFIGLPTPACTLLVVGILFYFEYGQFGARAWLGEIGVVYGLVALLSWLMNAEIPMFSFKFKELRWAGNELRFVFAAVALVLVVLMQELALAPIMLLYILLNVGIHYTSNRTDA